MSKAIAFDIGTAPGQPDWAFNRYASDLQRVITINQDAFSTAVSDGSSTTTGWTLVIPVVAAILIIGLTYADVRPASANTANRSAQLHERVCC